MSTPRRKRRPRKHISKEKKLAAALACLLPQEQRDDLRARKVPPAAVIRLFEFDHVGLHALGGSDSWWNLDPKQKKPHREKSRGDTSIVAKVDRLIGAHVRAGVPKAAAAPKRAPVKRKIAQRANPWPAKGTRKIRWRTEKSATMANGGVDILR